MANQMSWSSNAVAPPRFDAKTSSRPSLRTFGWMSSDVAAQARAIVPDGVEAAIELVGTNTLRDTLRATAPHGVVCFTGMLSNEWTVADFYPIDYIPSGVRLTAYSGDAADLPVGVLQAYLDAVAAGRLTVPIHRT
jgi:NADPH:quinone reductase